MSTAENIAVVQRFFTECLNKQDVNAAEGLISENFVSHFTGMPESRGVEAFKELGRTYFEAFPDFHLTPHDWISEGDRVVVRWTWTGTNDGPLMGMPATNRTVNGNGIGIYQVEDGRMTAQWVQEDMMGMMAQLGLGQPA